MEYLFDTNIFGELRRRDRVDPKALEFLQTIPATKSYISVISIMEMETGVLRMERKDAQQGQILRRWIEDVRQDYSSSRILGVDERIALRCAEMHVPDQRSPYDALIAATAECHGMTVVTRNDVDFSGLTVPVINPWRIGRA